MPQRDYLLERFRMAIAKLEGLSPTERARVVRGVEPHEPRGYPEMSTPYVAFCEYYATGEGVTVFIAVGCSRRHAEELIRQRADPFFHVGIEVKPLDLSDSDGQRIARWIPGPVLKAAQEGSGGPRYYGEFHLNRS